MSLGEEGKVTQKGETAGLTLFGVKLRTVDVVTLNRCSKRTVMVAGTYNMLLIIWLGIVGMYEIEIRGIGYSIEERTLSRLVE